MSATTGGGLQGKETQSLSFSGYILMRKPEFLRVLLLVPVVRTQALDMVSDGQNFKLYIPPRKRAIVGSNTLTTTSKNGLENLRPDVIYDSMFIQGPEQDQIMSMTTDIRVIESRQKEERPDRRARLRRPDPEQARRPDPHRSHCPRHPHQFHRPASLPAGHLRRRRPGHHQGVLQQLPVLREHALPLEHQ